MHSHSRSRDANIGTKSCKYRSIETKVQSTLSSSPKNKKSTPTSKNKQKSIKAEKKTIKASAKLKDFVTKITTKLQQFDKSSIINTPSTSSNISHLESQTISSVSYNSSEHQSYNKSTEVIIERLKQDKGLAKEKWIEQNQNGVLSNRQSNYNEVFQSALSRPHCLYRLMMQKRNPVSNGKTSIISEFKQFKKKQCQNWILINSQLTNYLKQQAEEENNKDRKKIEQVLIRQGKSNYQWVQIQDKLQYDNFEEALLQQSKKSTISIKKLEPQKQEQKQIVNEIKDQPVGQMLLSNLNWEKYIWDDEASSTSDLQCNSRVNSEIEYLHISAKDFIQETDQVQENVELILSWLMDQFVVELAHKLDFNLMVGLRADRKMDKSNQKQKFEDEGEKSFLQSINQICEDSNKIREFDLSLGQKLIPKYYSDALLEMELYNPRLSKKQIKQQLIKSIVNRDIDICEIYLRDEEQEEEWIRMSFLYELEEIVWQALIMEQTCRLWMG